MRLQVNKNIFTIFSGFVHKINKYHEHTKTTKNFVRLAVGTILLLLKDKFIVIFAIANRKLKKWTIT